MSVSINARGQATVEYLFLILFLLTLSYQLVMGFTNFMTGQVGNLGHVLTYSLSTGVCEEDCFYKTYYNGYRQ